MRSKNPTSDQNPGNIQYNLHLCEAISTTAARLAGSAKHIPLGAQILTEDSWIDLSARMMATVQFLDPLASDMRVNLCRRQVTVPEQHLHDTQIGAMIQ